MPTAGAFAAEWRDLARTLALPSALSADILTELQAGYGDPGRHYHTDRHIVSMLKQAADLNLRDRDAARLAIFFHDVIYDPTRNDNERCSAYAMTQRLSGHVPTDRLNRAAVIIEATAGHQATGDHDTDLVLDLDMAILGQPWPVYQTYARGVMAEYLPYIGETAWRQGRVSLFLDPILARGKIFLTDHFKPLDALAMENLQREKAWLTSDQSRLGHNPTMTVYIDDMYRYAIGQFRGMKMSHMISDDEDALHDMAERLGLRRAWHQGDHYDVPLDARDKAVRLGAIEITYRQASAMRRRQVVESSCGDPAEAIAWLKGWFAVRN